MTHTNNTQENLEAVFYNLLAEGHRSDAAYDCLVLFSGGKDSTYMAHMLKLARGGRVCLFSVDNGFEAKSHFDFLKAGATKLKMDLYLYQPPFEEFVTYYNFLLTEDLLKSFDSNPLCFFCARYFMALGLEFADRMNIPFVFYGATPMQLTGNKLARTLEDIALYEPVTRMVRESMYRKIKKANRYQNDAELRKVIDKVFYTPQRAMLMFPFQYLEYNIQKIIATLEQNYGWQAPAPGLSSREYLTSGCELLALVYAVAEKRGFVMHELAQLEQDYASGIMSEEAYTFNKALFEKMLKGKTGSDIKKLADMLGLNDLLAE